MGPQSLPTDIGSSIVCTAMTCRSANCIGDIHNDFLPRTDKPESNAPFLCCFLPNSLPRRSKYPRIPIPSPMTPQTSKSRIYHVCTATTFRKMSSAMKFARAASTYMTSHDAVRAVGMSVLRHGRHDTQNSTYGCAADRTKKKKKKKGLTMYSTNAKRFVINMWPLVTNVVELN